jgi:dienelactone hydrolase
MRQVLSAIAFLFAIIGFSGDVHAQFRIEIYPINTRTLSAAQFLTGKSDGPDSVIGGELRIPRYGEDRLPAIILVHGSGGVASNVTDWAIELNRLGLVVFILDSFTGRGIGNTVADQSQLSPYAMLYDAYRALEILSKHPRVDPKRIAIMGFSKGAFASLYSATRRFSDSFAPQGVRFAAHMAFYGPCETAYIDDTRLTGAPVRLFHGLADDYVPSAPCKDYVQRLKAAGADAMLFEYAGAHHAFDTRLPGPIPLPQAITIRKCHLAERPLGIIVNQKTGKPLTMGDTCIERGATIAPDASALEAARKEVAAFLKTQFGM